MSRRETAVLLLAGTAVVIALVSAGVARGSVLLAYVLFVAATLLAFLLGRMRAALPPAADFGAKPRTAASKRGPVDHFDAYKLRLAVATSTPSDLHFRLRRRVRRIVSARLSRRYGIDLDREPERAAEVMRESRTWELIRPDREPPKDDVVRGRPENELEQLIEELESL
jgi:hypothetical protein